MFDQQVVNSSGVKRLHKRVEHSALCYGNVERKGLGPFKVCSFLTYDYIFNFNFVYYNISVCR